MGTPWTQDPMDAPPCVILSPVDVQANALARHLAVPPGALRAASLRKQSFLRRIRTGARAYALAPWGMQPNTSPAALSPRFPWAFHCSCLYGICRVVSFNAEAQRRRVRRVFYGCCAAGNAATGDWGLAPRYKTLLMCYHEIGSQCEASSNRLCVLCVSASLR